MIRIRALFAVGGLLLALAMLSAAACGGGSGGKAKTATPRTTGTASPPAATTRTPAAQTTPGATGQPTGGTAQPPTPAPPTSTYPPGVTPPSAFDKRSSQQAIEFLRDLNGELRDISGERAALERAIPGRSSRPTPTLIRPGSGTWFEECCASDLRSFQRVLDSTERRQQRVATIYSDTGHTQGKAMMDQFVAQLNQIRDVLQAVASAATPQGGLDELDAVSPILDALRNTVSAALSCCTAYNPATPTR